MSGNEKNNSLERTSSGKERENKVTDYQSNLGKLNLFSLLLGFHFITGILLPFFLTWGGLTFLEVILLQSYFVFAVLIFEIPGGAIADYFSRKFSLFLGTLSIAFAALIYSSIPSIILFIIAETLWGFGEALFSGTIDAITYDTLRKLEREEEISKISARRHSYFLLGIMISAPMGSMLALFVPLNYVFRFMFFPFVIAAIVSMTLKEPNDDLERENKNYLTVVKSGFKELRNNKILRILAFDLIVIDVLVFFIIWSYQIYLDDLGVPIYFFGFVAAGMTLVQIICSNLIPKCIDRFKNKKLFLLIYTLIPGIGFVLLALIPITPVAIILLLIIVGFGFTRWFIFIKAVNKIMENNNRATVISTISMIGCLLKALVYPFIGLLAMYDLKATFIVLGALIVGFAVFSRVKNEYL